MRLSVSFLGLVEAILSIRVEILYESFEFRNFFFDSITV